MAEGGRERDRGRPAGSREGLSFSRALRDTGMTMSTSVRLSASTPRAPPSVGVWNPAGTIKRFGGRLRVSARKSYNTASVGTTGWVRT